MVYGKFKRSHANNFAISFLLITFDLHPLHIFSQCQINTDPMKSALGYLAVVVPPDIIDFQTSHDMAVDEGQNVTLTCKADGLPEPTIEVILNRNFLSGKRAKAFILAVGF